MSDEIKKSNYGPAGTAAAAQYQPHVNQERKARNVDTVEGIGHNKNVKAFSSKPGQLSAKQQAAKEVSPARVKKLSGPIIKPQLTDEEKARYLANMKKEEMIEVEPDGKREVVEGKEPLKKDPKTLWKRLKKALNHKKAFIDLEDEMGLNEEEETPPPEQAQPGQEAPPESEQPQQVEESQTESPQEGVEGQAEAVSDSPEETEAQPEEQENSEEGAEETPVDPEELMSALKEEGYSDQEIAYIVHGHHAPEVDPTKQAKAQATSAMSEQDLDSASKMAELEHQHAEQSMAAEREHKKRMSDLEYEQAQQANPQAIEQAHKQRMLDLEYEKAKKDASTGDGGAGDAEADKQMKMLEVEKKKLELQLRKEEMKMELEFKKREHELKLKMMEQQLKEQGKQKSEIGGIKHEQKLAEAKNPPKLIKKPLKKNEEDND